MSTHETLEDRLARAKVSTRSHDVMINLLCSPLERHADMLERHEVLVAEVRRDAQQTQRLWTRMARKYGWLDDGS